ncbi:hypothetical protein VSS74_11480 [Conexibacter stalactiti]|uniref:Flp pilus-assembly TadG-like N-terminal domain-containing protein n=1 Tax=Conexibacter stalactiti TaxID=1940611 RepID=A0ABU4HSC2_9ACTN|nr:hypothetical protein [Conexibacter stalactiti]MDW5594964.1 hypothetical protein [Conexibacter stalactiti]MEC5035606.1 hypothetical protein [Conexibacter stalactiti]
MGRPSRYLVVAAAAVLFLLASAGLARVLNANSAERAAIETALEAQAGGNVRALVASIDGCAQDAGCRASAEANAAALRSSGEVKVARLDLSTNFSPFGADGTARVVWTTPTRLTVVQCARIHRAGDVFGGIEVELLDLSRPIDRESSCP